MLLFWECPCALAVNQKCIVMIVTAYCHLLSDGLRQENGEENTNSIQFATSKSSSKYFSGSLFQAAGGHCLYIFAGLCTTPSSYALLLSNKSSKLCFFSLSSLLHFLDFTWPTPNSMDFASVPFVLGSRYVQAQLKSDKHKPLFLQQGKAANAQHEAPLVRGGIFSVLLTSYELVGRPVHAVESSAEFFKLLWT